MVVTLSSLIRPSSYRHIKYTQGLKVRGVVDRKREQEPIDDRRKSFLRGTKPIDLVTDA